MEAANTTIVTRCRTAPSVSVCAISRGRGADPIPGSRLLPTSDNGKGLLPREIPGTKQSIAASASRSGRRGRAIISRSFPLANPSSHTLIIDTVLCADIQMDWLSVNLGLRFRSSIHGGSQMSTLPSSPLAWRAGLVVVALLVPALAACASASASTAPTVASASSSARSSGTASSSPLTDGSGVTTVFNAVAQVTVPAGGSIDVPVVFEQSPSAQITVFAGSSTVGATFAGTGLSETQTTENGRVLGATLSSPTDTSLHLANPGSSDASVLVTVQIDSGRHLKIIGPIPAVASGATASFEVDLTEPVVGDVVQAEYIDPAGTHTPISLTPAGNGKWTGQFTSTIGGAGSISARTTGNGIRFARFDIDVMSGAVTLSSTFTERLSDTNGDNLAEALVLSPTITVDKAGTYEVRADLDDSAGNPVAGLSGLSTASGYYEFAVGSQPLNLSFEGSTIYKSGRSGPYHLKNVRIALVENNQTHPVVAAADMGATQAYDYQLFEHYPASGCLYSLPCGSPSTWPSPTRP